MSVRKGRKGRQAREGEGVFARVGRNNRGRGAGGEGEKGGIDEYPFFFYYDIIYPVLRGPQF